MNAFRSFQKILAVLLISIAMFFAGFYYGRSGYDVYIKKNPPTITIINKAPTDQTIDFALFWKVWELVQKEYLERPVDGQKMLYGAINGMVASLGDPYTSFLAPQINQVFDDSLNNKYEGIGAELGMKDSQLIIVSPIDGSPAKAAGVHAGDAILKINGESTFGITVTDAVSKIRGTSGTPVVLTLLRDTTEPFDLEIMRGVIKIDSVTWEDKGDGTAYIRVSRFGEDTNKQWDKVVKELNVKMSELDAVVIDLRGNPGGYLQSATYLAGEFFKGKAVVYQEDSLGNQVPLNADRQGSFVRIPKVVILLDQGSASASEILAAALKFHLDAQIVGEKSFGKGTVQSAQDFEDGSSIHITTAKWLTPGKDWIHGKGISPDIEVKRTAEDYNNNRDPQLEKALEIAKSF